MNRNSMCLWWPKIKDLPIPMPETVILEEPRKDLLVDFFAAVADLHEVTRRTPVLECNGTSARIEAAYKRVMEDFGPYEDRIHEEADKLGYPLFWRTDLHSGKHDYERTCFVANRDGLKENLYSLLEVGWLANIAGTAEHRAIVLREFLDLDSTFKAFRGLPIAAERRYFVEGGKVLCRHPYWPEEAFTHGMTDQNWQELLAELNRQHDWEVALLINYATAVSAAVRGYWSVDFARAKDGTWYLIDMARGEDSWHPDACLVAKERER